jgi:uncharacterized protein (DUF433 family)
MALNIQSDVLPLQTSTDGIIYVGQTRVPLETVIIAFHRGATPEEIVTQYPALLLAQVYRVIAYYLENRIEVDVYIQEQATRSEQVRHEIAAHTDLVGIRECLLARREKLLRGDP